MKDEALKYLYDIVWDIIEEDLGELRSDVENLLAQEGSGDPER